MLELSPLRMREPHGFDLRPTFTPDDPAKAGGRLLGMIQVIQGQALGMLTSKIRQATEQNLAKAEPAPAG